MQTMWGELETVLMAAPVAWNPSADWRRLGYLRAPDAAAASAQHSALADLLGRAGATVLWLPAPDDNADAVYTHDASFPTDDGVIILRMGKHARAKEPSLHRAFLAEAGFRTRGEIVSPGTVEGGDLVWLDPQTLLVGRGFRTNAYGIEQLRSFLPRVAVVDVHLPYGPGPGECLHLMSLMSVLDANTVLVDRSWLTVVCLETLEMRGIRLIDIDPAERQTFACNVLALGGGRVVALSQNPSTNRRLEAAGFTVLTFDGSEIALNGGGGPTCLTRPLRRR